jgi:hypothetical protein
VVPTGKRCDGIFNVKARSTFFSVLRKQKPIGYAAEEDFCRIVYSLLLGLLSHMDSPATTDFSKDRGRACHGQKLLPSECQQY